jgi:hypothetical protein
MTEASDASDASQMCLLILIIDHLRAVPELYSEFVGLAFALILRTTVLENTSADALRPRAPF